MSEGYKSEYKDKDLICTSCKKLFKWLAGEQMFMEKLLEQGDLDKEERDEDGVPTGKMIPGQIIPPKRCPECRELKKARIEKMKTLQK